MKYARAGRGLTDGSRRSSDIPAPLGPAERVRLWLSYQRYGLLMTGLPTLIWSAIVWSWPGAWWAWIPLAALALWFVRHAIEILGRFPRKMRATLLADRRIAAGRFHPRTIRRYCGDPCFRVVAREILRRAGIPPDERRALIERYAEEEAERGHTLVFARADGSVQIRVDGKQIRRLPQPGAIAPVQQGE
ncbi:MAG: hypothetical protein KC583_03540 [Myxococcales bacterium]|nr:hypothetical protein [Myxococcales bacterium]